MKTSKLGFLLLHCTGSRLKSYRKSVERVEASSCFTAAKKAKGFRVLVKSLRFAHISLGCLEEELSPDMCANLVNNYKKSLTAVLVNKGFSTKY